MSIQINSCPSCEGELIVRELYCPTCDIQIRGSFAAPSPAAPTLRLSQEQQAFLRLFVMSRGNLSDVERSLGVSYPTVRAKLDDLIAAFTEESGSPESEADELNREEILARVADGRLSPDEGMSMLRRLASEA
ncbi:MAG: DUF2089 domain-containing protein [Thermomicrobiales bacterium]|nr:DUF2089 domain-containing protein [Thermomicrobiales bacterium]